MIKKELAEVQVVEMQVQYQQDVLLQLSVQILAEVSEFLQHLMESLDSNLLKVDYLTKVPILQEKIALI